ncbi:hypothetical protein ACFVXA_07985 [Streptomyces sp. NPDC058246]|uniref:hypothetical protein n=1 Tax=Streptomyces sp. NPDC058246 TaxID=3346400 RepID=UPI0036E30722
MRTHRIEHPAVGSPAGTMAAGAPATRCVMSFHDGQALLEEDELSERPARLLTGVQRQVHARIPDLGAERRERHDERPWSTLPSTWSFPAATRSCAWWAGV